MRGRMHGWTILTLAAYLPLATVAGAADAPLPGVWQRHEYVLSYAGFTGGYSCDGIAQKVRLLLLAAGARDDLKVVGICNSPSGGPSRSTAARTSFSTLAPEPGATAPERAAGATPEAPPEPGMGAWKTVELRDGKPGWLQWGDCELVEQFGRELLPFFATRNRQIHMSCMPHQYVPGAISLRFETFAPLPKPRAGQSAMP